MEPDPALALPPSVADDASLSAIPSRLSQLVEAGELEAALDDPLASQLLGAAAAGELGVANRVREYVKGFEGAAAAAAAASVASLGAAALSLFAQLNWTGPPLAPGGDSRAHRCVASEEANKAALAALEADGESPYTLLQAPSLLWVARALLLEPLDVLEAAEAGGWSVSWWAARCAQLQQRCLSSSAPSLEKLATRCMRTVLEAIDARAAPTADAASLLAPLTQVVMVVSHPYSPLLPPHCILATAHK
jgi:hypothetical protein